MDRRRDIISRTAPPPDLAPLVEAFAGRSAIVQRATFPVFPTARAELIFHFGDPFLVTDALATPLSPLPRAVLLGPRSQSYWQSAGPRIDWFLIQLTPLGCRRLLGIPFAKSWHREIALTDLWGALLERLAAASSFEARRALAVTAIRTLSSEIAADPVSRAGSLARAGRIRTVDALARHLDVGPRRLHQRFVTDYGIGPKHFLSLMRFGRQLQARHPLRQRDVDWDEPEYADESHAIREFRRFTGMTPSAYVRQKRGGDQLVHTGAPILLG